MEPTNPVARPAQPTNIIALANAAMILIVLFSFEQIAAFALRDTGTGIVYYHAALALTCILFLATLLLGQNLLVRDIQELCLYDVFVQIFGLVAFVPGAEPYLYFVLAQTINWMKLTRIIWPLLYRRLGLLCIPVIVTGHSGSS